MSNQSTSTMKTCEVCNKSFKNLTLHQSKAHKKDMWKIVIPKCFLETTYWDQDDEAHTIKVYSFGKLETELYCEGGGPRWASFYVGIESKNTLKATLLQVCFPYNCRKEDISVQYHIKGKSGNVVPVDKNNYTIEFE